MVWKGPPNILLSLIWRFMCQKIFITGLVNNMKFVWGQRVFMKCFIASKVPSLGDYRNFFFCHFCTICFFNIPNVVGAVLQTPPSFINSVILFLPIFKTLSFLNRKLQGADILRECSSPTTCNISHVTCHMSRVMCHVSQLVSFSFSFFSRTKWWRQSVEGLLPTEPTPSSLLHNTQSGDIIL